MTGIPPRRRILLVAVLSIIGSTLIVSTLWAVLVSAQASTAIRETQKTNVPKIDKTAETLTAVKALAVKINSCTDPTGACAKQGRAQTAAAVADISVRQIAAVACADQRGTQSALQIKACVDRTMRVILAAEVSQR